MFTTSHQAKELQYFIQFQKRLTTKVATLR